MSNFDMAVAQGTSVSDEELAAIWREVSQKLAILDVVLGIPGVNGALMYIADVMDAMNVVIDQQRARIIALELALNAEQVKDE